MEHVLEKPANEVTGDRTVISDVTIPVHEMDAKRPRQNALPVVTKHGEPIVSVSVQMVALAKEVAIGVLLNVRMDA